MMAISKIMKAKRYAELLRKAKANLHTYNYLLENKFKFPECLEGFKPEDFLVGSVDASISAIEAFVNRLGYIFIDNWQEIEANNFWMQYKKVINILQCLDIDIASIKKTPYQDFKKYREIVRNPYHHVKSSKHDVNQVRRNSPLDIEEDMQESIKMLHCWVAPTLEDAKNACEQTELFIKYFQAKFKEKFFDSFTLEEILLVQRNGNLSDDELRQELLRYYIDDPLHSLALVVQTNVICS